MTDEVIVEANEVAAVPEKSLTVEQVNEIVRREKAQAMEKAKREMQAQHERELEQYRAANPSVGGVSSNVDVEKIYQQVADRFQAEQAKRREEEEREAFQNNVDKVASTYVEKMSVGPTLYDDFEKVTSEFNPTAFPQVVFLAANLDNTAHVMYELANNPNKLMMIDYLAQKDPKAAMLQLQKLSDSITNNLSAKENNQSAMAPLPRLQPSVKAGADNGELSIQDYKRQPWLRA